MKRKVITLFISSFFVSDGVSWFTKEMELLYSCMNANGTRNIINTPIIIPTAIVIYFFIGYSAIQILAVILLVSMRHITF